MLPRETCAPGWPLVEEKTRGALSQVRQGRHLTLGHEPFGQGELQAIKADSQYLTTRHPGTSLPFTASSEETVAVARLRWPNSPTRAGVTAVLTGEPSMSPRPLSDHLTRRSSAGSAGDATMPK